MYGRFFVKKKHRKGAFLVLYGLCPTIFAECWWILLNTGKFLETTPFNHPVELKLEIEK